jgi:hypothetical protein
MRKVRPTPENTNHRGFYIEVIEMANWSPYNYLVCFRPLSMYNVDTYYPRVPTYYVGLLAPRERLAEAVTAVNDIFCEDELRRGNSDWHPEPMVPIPLDDTELDVLHWQNSMRSLQHNARPEDRLWEYATSAYTDYPTDALLTPTRFDDTLEKWSSRWVL